MESESKSIFASKIFWANLLGVGFAYLMSRGMSVPPEQQEAIIVGAMALANIALRFFTTQPVHLMPPPTAPAASAGYIELMYHGMRRLDDRVRALEIRSRTPARAPAHSPAARHFVAD